MAADDDRDGTPDPWDEIVADSLGEGPDEVSFRFEEAAAEGEPADAVPDEAGTAAEFIESVGETDAAAAEAAEHSLVEDWLAGDDGAAASEVPPLSVFAPTDAAGGSSAIDIGTGESGITLHGEAGQEEIGTDTFTDAEAAEAAAGEWAAIETSAAASDDAAEAGFPELATGAAAVVAGGAAAVPAKTVRRPARPVKKGGIGQIVGIVLGALLAFPIVGGILIGYAWMGGRDAIGLRKTPLAFLMPPKSKPSSTNAVAGGSSLDNLAAMSEPAPVEPATEPAAVEPDAVEPDAVEPDAAVPPVDDLAAADAVEPIEPAPSVEPEPEPLTEPGAEPGPPVDAVAVDEPAAGALDALDAARAPALPTVPAAAPEPPPLDTAALDAAVVDAAALGAALSAVDDKENRAYMLLRTRWYRAIARVAEELVAVEDQATTTGRPLVGPPANVETLHGDIGSRTALMAELAALAPDWLAYAKRGSDGVVLPLTFASARKVGPLWTIHAALTGVDGRPSDLTVVTRREPTAVEGDRIVVTGVALDGATVWAADVRAAEPAAGF